MNGFIRTLLGAGASVTCVAAGLALPSVAQAQTQAAASEEGSSGLTDIVVTAQRRSERLQDVPIAVSAFTSEALESRGVASTVKLGEAVAGLNISRASSSTQVFLRGVGSQTIQPGSDPSVATYVDGVYLSSPQSLVFSFNNVERIEVLKGPQGTLFGRNATGGLIQIITKDPTGETEAKASIGFSRFNKIDANAYIAGGSDKLAASLSALFSRQMDGWGTNVFTRAPGTSAFNLMPDRDVGTNREFGLHGKVVMRPNEETTIKISAIYTKNNGNQFQYRSPLPGQGILVPASAGEPANTVYFREPTLGFWDTNTDVNFEAKSRQILVSVDAAYEADFATVKSISSYLDANNFFLVPSDSSPLQSRFSSITNINFETFTQEFQLLSNDKSGPDWLNWITGLYYLHSNGFQVLNTGISLRDLDTSRRAGQISDSYAAYGQATAKFTDRDSITLGLRFNRDDISARQVLLGLNPTAAPGTTSILGAVNFFVGNEDAKKTYKQLTYKAVYDHHFTDDVMAYASYSRGYKSGSFNHGSLCPLSPVTQTCPTIQPPLKPEILDSYELGFKTMFFDRKLRANISLFHYDYKDLQVSAVSGIPPVSVLNNAAQAKIDGVDVDGEARLTSNFSVRFNAAYVDAKYDDYPGAVKFTRRTASPYGAAQSVFNAADKRLSRTPKFSGSLGATYTIPSSVGEFELSGTVYHTSKVYWDPENHLATNSYELYSGQIAWKPNDKWRVRLWGANLSNAKYYAQMTASAFGEFGSPGAPRTYGVAVDWQL